MRRKDQEIKDRNEIDSIIGNAVVCHLGVSDEGQPYIIPMNFGYDGKNIYLHSARVGRKIDILKKNELVCFEFEEVGDLEESEKACDWGIKYRTVIGFGKASFIEDMQEKKKALGILMKQYSDRKFEFPEGMLKAVAVIRIDIDEMTGKRSS